MTPVESPGGRFSVPYVEIRDVDQRPRVLAIVSPEFPTRFLSDSQFIGSCVVESVVGSDGNIVESRVARADDESLGIAVVTAVARWKFSPALKGGNPVGCRIKVPFIFFTKQPPDRQTYDAFGKQGDYPPFLVSPEDKEYRAAPTRAGSDRD